MIPAFTGIALLAPSILAITGAGLLMVALELHVRLIEEPYLLRVHGEQYAAYGARVGRFVPAIGRLRPGRDEYTEQIHVHAAATGGGPGNHNGRRMACRRRKSS
jgi:hypothetical protein